MARPNLPPMPPIADATEEQRKVLFELYKEELHRLNPSYLNKDGSARTLWDQVKEIAETKMPDLNAFEVESAMKMVAGTARSMGINVKGQAPWAN